MSDRTELLPKFVLALSERGEAYFVDYSKTIKIKVLCRGIKLYIYINDKS